MEITISMPKDFHDEFSVEYKLDDIFYDMAIDKVIYDNDDDMIMIIRPINARIEDVLNKVIRLIGLCHHDGCCDEVKIVSFKN